MLRRLQTLTAKNIDTQLKAAVAMVRGRLVQKDIVNNTAILPTSQEGLYFVDKDVQPTGLMAYEGEISDYDTRLETIAQNDFVQLERPFAGERFATTEFVSTGFSVGDYAEVSTVADATQGKLIKKATAGAFKYDGTVVENGHTLAIFEVV